MTDKFLFIDPGTSTGWAKFTDLYMPAGKGVCRGVDAFAKWINEQPPAEIVGYEDFHLFGHKAMAQTGSKMEASQAIGILKLKATEWGAELIPFRPGTYRTGMMYAGQRVPKSHIADDLSAYYTGIFHLVTKGYITSQGRTVITRETLLNRLQ